MNVITKSKSRRTDGDDPFFLPYQKRWIEDGSRMKLMEKGRQIGLSWASAYAVVRQQASVNAYLDCWVSSRDEIQARLFLEDCKSFAQLLEVAAEDLGLQVIDDGKGTTAYVLRFANGRRIHSLTSSVDAQAGKRGTRVLDEFALHEDSRRLYTVAYPGITWGGQMGIISTHRGTDNFFNELVKEIKHKGNPKGFSLHRVTLVDAIEQGFLRKLQAKLPPGDERKEMSGDEYLQFIRNGCPDEESWQQEYLCQPADDVTAFLAFDLIASCEYPDGENWQTSLNGSGKEVYVGVDVGRDHDLTVIWVIEKVSGTAFTRRVLCMEREPFRRQEEALYELLNLSGTRRACIDQSGLGRQFAERAEERFGRYRVEGLVLSGPVKEMLAYPVRAAFEEGTLRIPSDKSIRADLRAIRKETTLSGNIRFTADRGKNGHSDRFWALALALHASKRPAGAGHFESTSVVTRRRPNRRRSSSLI